MQKFKVKIVETYRRCLEMEAPDEDTAYQIIDKKIEEGSIDLPCDGEGYEYDREPLAGVKDVLAPFNRMDRKLYRAKRTDTGEWIEGYYSEIKLTGAPYILTGEITIETCRKDIVQFECYEVLLETVCQYTGFNDIRGNKVFEHSIVFYEDSGVYGEVVFRDGKYEIKWQSGHDDLRVDVCFWFTQRKVYVVGNVFDDFGVLEQGSKSILVIDTPNSCDECPLFSAAYSDMKCRGNGMGIDYPYPNDKVQEWCPLKPLPEKTN